MYKLIYIELKFADQDMKEFSALIFYDCYDLTNVFIFALL